MGWYNYLYGDNARPTPLIKADNPEMTDELHRLLDRGR